MSAENGEFPTGPSFLDYDRPEVRMVELPAWLQTFAATVGEPDDEWPQQEPGETDDDTPPMAVEDEDDELVPWLQKHDSSQNGVAAGNGSAVDPSFMISEEDLPDWLRSIPPGEANEAAGVDSAVGSGGIPIPNVSRAWVPDTEQHAAPDESASVFSLVASQGPQAAYSGAGEQSVEGDQFHALEQTRPVLAHGGSAGSPASSNSRVSEDAGTDRSASKLLPLLAGIALLVLILLIVIFLL